MWTTDAPLSPEQIKEDRPALEAITFPEGAVLNSAEVYVNGRLWYWERLSAPINSGEFLNV